ncbi:MULTISPECIES: NUMOD3 domain-containing DNA-binding protein [unclassified Agromyces]|uniref:NUMOD3 domain-containing DNA-binding protein n=1 Tax=unclassified Agromyces TaxID=2639701 RepID=UPI0030152763
MLESIEYRRREVGYAGLVGGVYGVRTLGSSEYRYVGQTTLSCTKRMSQHLKAAKAGQKTAFYDWLRKTDDWHIVPLELIWTSLEDLGEAEKRWIVDLRAQGHRLLNLTAGGLGAAGFKWTDEMREAARQRMLGRPGVSMPGAENPMFGRSHTDEQKARWSELRKGTNAGEANPNFGKFGPAHPAYGRVFSPETLERLSEQKRGEKNPNYGKTASAETRAKMSAVRKGRPMPSSVRNAHTRHHTNKGVFKETCRHCIDDRNNERGSS